MMSKICAKQHVVIRTSLDLLSNSGDVPMAQILVMFLWHKFWQCSYGTNSGDVPAAQISNTLPQQLHSLTDFLFVREQKHLA